MSGTCLEIRADLDCKNSIPGFISQAAHGNQRIIPLLCILLKEWDLGHTMTMALRFI